MAVCSRSMSWVKTRDVKATSDPSSQGYKSRTMDLVYTLRQIMVLLPADTGARVI